MHYGIEVILFFQKRYLLKLSMQKRFLLTMFVKILPKPYPNFIFLNLKNFLK